MVAILRLFISYARRDARTLALRLQADLIRAGYDVWLDTAEIDGGASWSREIEDGIDRCDCGLALLSHGSFDSEICRAEQLRLLRKRKRVIPLLVQADAERPLHLEALNYRDFSDDTRYATTFVLLKDDLSGAGNISTPPSETPTNADPLPPDYIIREELLDVTRAAVLDDATDRRVALTALAGMGGIGKSVLASALCHDEAVRDAYPDGVIWVKVGQNPGSLVPHMRLIGKLLGDAEHHYASETEAKSRLRTFLPGKSVLIVLDDVWDVRQVLPFVVEARRCRVLFTTRDAGIARDTRVGAAILTVHEMKPVEALDLLRQTTRSRSPELAEIAREVGYHPLALSLAGGRIKSGMVPSDWLAAYHETRKIAARRGAKDRHENIEACFDLSVAALDDEDRPLYHTLGIFPDDVWIPRATVVRLWMDFGLSGYDAGDLIERLVDLALVEQRPDDDALTLHDLLHDYNLNRLGGHAAETHRRMIEAWGDPYALPDAFAWRYYPNHLIGAGQADRLRDLLLDYRWLRAKLEALDVNALIEDYVACLSVIGANREVKQPLRLVRSAISNAAHIVNKRKEQFAPQLIGRLLTYRDLNAGITSLLVDAEAHADQPVLLPATASLTSAGGPLLQTLTGHGGAALSAQFSPDSARIASSSSDNTIRVWDVHNGLELHVLTGHTEQVISVQWSSDGQRLLSASWDGTVSVWDVASGDRLLTLVGHSQGVNAAKWSPDERYIASASNDTNIKLWEADSGSEHLTLSEHMGPIFAVSWSPDGKRIASASGDQTIKVWDSESGQSQLSLTDHTSMVTGIDWSQDKKRIISVSWDKTVKVWDANNGQILFTMIGHELGVNSVACDPSGGRIASGSNDKTVRLWDINTGRELLSLTGHTGAVTSVSWSEDGRHIVSAARDNSIKMWDVVRGENSESTTSHIHVGQVTSLEWEPNGNRILGASSDQMVRLWESGTDGISLTLSAHTQSVMGAAWSPDGRQIASASRDRTVKLWDVETGSEVYTLTGHTNFVNAVAWSPDGRRIASAAYDTNIKVWEADSGRELLTLGGHTKAATSVAWSPDGRYLASASADRTVKTWDASSGREILTLRGHRGFVRSVVWSPDGRNLLSAAADNSSIVWDAITANALIILTGHLAEVWSAKYSSDGRLIVSGSNDRTIRIWDAATGVEVVRFDADAPVRCASFSPDGKRIAAGDDGGNIHWLSVVGLYR